MLNNNNHDHSCEFFAEIVSYLYNETGESERRRFESHLSNCDVCTDEFAAISNARFSIFEWQREEFAKLPTPEFHKAYAVNRAEIVGMESKGFLSTLRKAFSFGSWESAVPAFGAVLLCMGLAIAAFIYLTPKGEQIADNNQPNTIKNIPDGPDSIAVPSRPIGEKEGAKIKESENLRREVAGSKEIVNPSPKLSDRRPESQPARIVRHSFNESRREAMFSARPNLLQKQKALVLSKYDDYDDKSLRLSDLFEDGDS